MSGRLPPSVFVLAGAMVVSCTLFVDVDGLAGDRPDAGFDASAPVDAASDAEVRAPCPDGGFCDDFDDGGIGSGWTKLDTVGGTLTIASGRSQPSAVRSLLLEGVPATGKRAMLVKAFPERTSLHCSFSFWIEKANDDTDIAQLRWKTEDGRDFFVWLDSHPTNTVLGRAFLPSGPYFPNAELPLLARSRWVDIDLRTDFTSLEVRFDGALVHLAPFENGTTPRALGLQVIFGGESGETAANEFLYDDIRCE